jgi:hypothetical protein
MGTFLVVCHILTFRIRSLRSRLWQLTGWLTAPLCAAATAALSENPMQLGNHRPFCSRFADTLEKCRDSAREISAVGYRSGAVVNPLRVRAKIVEYRLNVAGAESGLEFSGPERWPWLNTSGHSVDVNADAVKL